jgi:hypothetical protein
LADLQMRVAAVFTSEAAIKSPPISEPFLRKSPSQTVNFESFSHDFVGILSSLMKLLPDDLRHRISVCFAVFS